jgi:hypothetical protein
MDGRLFTAILYGYRAVIETYLAGAYSTRPVCVRKDVLLCACVLTTTPVV